MQIPNAYNQDPKGPSRGEQIAIAVAIAGLSTLVSGLVGWGVEELRSRFGSKPKTEDKKDSQDLQGSP
jgi:hypothetical protein